jgi:hypothetical protein
MKELFGILHENGTLRTWSTGVPVLTTREHKTNKYWLISKQEKWVKVKVEICTPSRRAHPVTTTKGETMAKKPAKKAVKKVPKKAAPKAKAKK